MDALSGGFGRPFERLSDRAGGLTWKHVNFYPGPVQAFIAPKDGDYTFRAWGCGGGGNGINSSYYSSSGGTGAFCRKTLRLTKGQSVSIDVGEPAVHYPGSNGTDGPNGKDTTVTFPDGAAMVAGGGKGGDRSGQSWSGTAASVATGGDVNINGAKGLDGTTASVRYGVAAPGDDAFPGGGSDGVTATPSYNGRIPGGAGAGRRGSTGTNYQPHSSGGSGLVIVSYLIQGEAT